VKQAANHPGANLTPDPSPLRGEESNMYPSPAYGRRARDEGWRHPSLRKEGRAKEDLGWRAKEELRVGRFSPLLR